MEEFINLYYWLFDMTKLMGKLVFYCLVWYAGATMLMKGFDDNMSL